MQTDSARSAVVETKLYPGVGAARMLKRARLAPPREFRDGSCTVCVISAPAGYGKSTLMNSWHDSLREHGIACAWLSLDEDDDDPARLLRYLIAAYQRIDPAIGRSALVELAADLSASPKQALESLGAELSGLDRRAVLFLDDLQFLSAPEALDILDWLINYSPQSFQFVIGSRDEPRIHLGELRVRRQLLEYGSGQLHFSTEEAMRFLESRLGQALPPQDVEHLMAKTEGWPAAMELAALALQAEPDKAAVIQNFAGTERGVVDYLGEAVLARLDERTRNFILRLAQFDRFDAQLAEAVTGQADAADLLAGLLAKNLFLVPLNRESTWFRFHHLAAEFLRHRFNSRAAISQVLMTGADWLYRNGLTEEAINAAIRAEAWETATAWVAESVEELIYRRGYHQTILRWMTRLPAEWVDRFPTIRIHYTFALAFSPRQEEVEAQVHKLEQIRDRMLKSGAKDRALTDQIQCEIELQKVLSQALRDEGLGARAGAQAWLECWPDAPLIRRGTMGNVLAFGLKTAGEIDAAFEQIAKVRNWLQQAEGWYSLAWTEYLNALLHMKRGDYLKARSASQAGLDLLDRRLEGHPAHAALFHTVLATVAYEFDELDRARAHLDLCMPRVAEYGQADAVLMAFLVAAKLDRIFSGEESGLERLHEGQELGQQRNLPRLTISLAAEECGWHGRSGRLEEARRVAARHAFDRLTVPGTGSNLHSEKAFLVASRYLLRQRPQDVLARIDAPITRCRERGLYRRWVELLLIKALAHRHNGELPAAVQSLQEALMIAAPRNLFRVILDESADLVSLLDRLDPAEIRGTEAAPLARRLQQAIRETSCGQTPRRESAAGSGAGNGVVEDLSKREIAILKRLESDMSNKEIATAIFISEGTLKWHLHNIYGKLGVKNRSGAVVKAKALSVI